MEEGFVKFKMKSSRGFTVWVAFGSYGGFSIRYFKRFSLRFCLGWVSLVFVRCDIENTIKKMQDSEKRLTEMLKLFGVTVNKYDKNGNSLD